MGKMIACLQFYSDDLNDAHELTKLICDLEEKNNSQVEMLFFSRHDIGDPDRHPLIQEMVRLATLKFSKVHALRCNRKAIGYPAGPNNMWADLIQQIRSEEHT